MIIVLNCTGLIYAAAVVTVIFTDLKLDDPHHVWESCAEVLYICISLQLD